MVKVLVVGDIDVSFKTGTGTASAAGSEAGIHWAAL